MSPQKVATTVRDTERQRLVSIVSGVLAGVYAAGLLDGFFAIRLINSPDPQADLVVSLMLHMAMGVCAIPLAAAVAYGWMPLRWWLKEEGDEHWRAILGVVTFFGLFWAGVIWIVFWKRGIEVTAIDYRPLGLLAVGSVMGAIVYRLALQLGQWKVFIPLFLAALGTVGWFYLNVETAGRVVERLSFNGLTSKVVSRALRKRADTDGDGFPSIFCDEACDCDDNDAEISPVAVEIPENGIDDDCTEGDLRIPNTPALVRRPKPKREPNTESGLQTGKKERPNVLLITIDTLRADHLGAYGYHRDTSPNMDKLAEEGVVFRHARSQGPMTCFSVPVLVTGRYYSELKRSNGKWPQMHTDNVLMAEYFLDAGYHTASFHSIGYFVPLFQFDQGFLYYDASTVHDRGPTHWNPTSDMITDKTLAYFDKSIKDLPEGQPWFLWTYYGDPHSGYIRHKGLPSFGPTFPDIYDQEILYTDLHIARLLDGLRARGEMDNTYIIITSDHGEGLDKEEDHGYIYHGQHLFDNLLKVPLIFWGPGVKPGVSHRHVSNIDVLPTVLELSGLEEQRKIPLRGSSLVPYLRGEDPEHPPTFVEKTVELGTPEKGMIKWPWKIIWKMGINRFTLYNIKEDPKELNEVSEQHPKVFEQMKRDIQIWRSTVLQEIKPVRGQ